MPNEIVSKILNILQKHKGLSIKKLMDELDMKRSSLQYHLENLEEEGLIKREKRGKKYLYFASEDRVILNYYNKQIQEIDQIKNSLVGDNKISEKLPKRKLNLVIANYYDLLEKDREILEKYYEIKSYADKELLITPEELVYRSKNADVVVANWPCEIGSKEIDQLKKLRYLHTTTYMYSYIDLLALRKRGISFSHVPFEYKYIALTEFLVAQIFALLRPISKAARQTRVGINEFRNFAGEQLRGKTLGIVGTDYISRDLISVLRGFGTEVLVSNFDKNQRADSFGINRFTKYDELVRQSDILLFSSRINKNLPDLNLDRKLFGKLEKPVYIISLSKPDFIDYDEIRKNIYAGKIKGIALDFVNELVTVDGLISEESEVKKIMYLPNVIITPDIGWYTADSVENLNKYTTNALINYAQGKDDDLLF